MRLERRRGGRRVWCAPVGVRARGARGGFLGLWLRLELGGSYPYVPTEVLLWQVLGETLGGGGFFSLWLQLELEENHPLGLHKLPHLWGYREAVFFGLSPLVRVNGES